MGDARLGKLDLDLSDKRKAEWLKAKGPSDGKIQIVTSNTSAFDEEDLILVGKEKDQLVGLQLDYRELDRYLENINQGIIKDVAVPDTIAGKLGIIDYQVKILIKNNITRGPIEGTVTTLSSDIQKNEGDHRHFALLNAYFLSKLIKQNVFDKDDAEIVLVQTETLPVQAKTIVPHSFVLFKYIAINPETNVVVPKYFILDSANKEAPVMEVNNENDPLIVKQYGFSGKTLLEKYGHRVLPKELPPEKIVTWDEGPQQPSPKLEEKKWTEAQKNEAETYFSIIKGEVEKGVGSRAKSIGLYFEELLGRAFNSNLEIEPLIRQKAFVRVFHLAVEDQAAANLLPTYQEEILNQLDLIDPEDIKLFARNSPVNAEKIFEKSYLDKLLAEPSPVVAPTAVPASSSSSSSSSASPPAAPSANEEKRGNGAPGSHPDKIVDDQKEKDKEKKFEGTVIQEIEYLIQHFTSDLDRGSRVETIRNIFSLCLREDEESINDLFKRMDVYSLKESLANAFFQNNLQDILRRFAKKYPDITYSLFETQRQEEIKDFLKNAISTSTNPILVKIRGTTDEKKSDKKTEDNKDNVVSKIVKKTTEAIKHQTRTWYRWGLFRDTINKAETKLISDALNGLLYADQDSLESLKKDIEAETFDLRGGFGSPILLSEGTLRNVPHRIAIIHELIRNPKNLSLEQQVKEIAMAAAEGLNHPSFRQSPKTKIFYEKVLQLLVVQSLVKPRQP